MGSYKLHCPSSRSSIYVHQGCDDSLIEKFSPWVSDTSITDRLTSIDHSDILQPRESEDHDAKGRRTLSDYVRGNLLTDNSRRLNELSTYMRLANALGYLHDRQIVHRDVRPDNVFAGDNLLLFDFDLSQQPGEFQGKDHGSLRCYPPEGRSKGQSVDYSFDTFMLGHMIKFQYVNWVVEPDCDMSLLNAIVRECLSPDPSQRPGTGYELEARLMQAAPTKVDLSLEVN